MAEIKRKEEENRLKQEQFRQQTEKILQDQQHELQLKKEELERRDLERKEVISTAIDSKEKYSCSFWRGCKKRGS